MAKPVSATLDDIMKPAALKSILKVVKAQEGRSVGRALCLTGDKTGAVILVDKL